MDGWEVRLPPHTPALSPTENNSATAETVHQQQNRFWSVLSMQLRPGDRVVIEYEAEVLAVHRGGGQVTGLELATVGAPAGETWLVAVEVFDSSSSRGYVLCQVRPRRSSNRRSCTTRLAGEGTRHHLPSVLNKTGEVPAMGRNIIADDKETRIQVLQDSIDDFAEQLANGGGQELLDRILGMLNRVHSYSFNNLLLQQIQAPDSRLVASMTAFDEIAAEQDHESVRLGRKRSRVHRARGAKSVWILMPLIREMKEEDEETGEVDTVNRCVGFRSVPTWAAEEIVYADTGEPFEVPDLSVAIEDRPLFDGLNDFAASKGIAIDHKKLFGGVRGVSRGGEVVLDERDDWTETLSILAHEIGHELLHRDKEDPDRPDRKIREAEAETLATVLLRYFGHDTAENSRVPAELPSRRPGCACIDGPHHPSRSGDHRVRR